MRYLVRLGVLQVPHVSSRVASSFFSGKGGGGGSRRQSRVATRGGVMSDSGVNNRLTARAESSRVVSHNGVRETSGMAVKNAELLFPDAQTHELGDMEVADEHEAIVLGKQGMSEEEEGEVHAPPNLKRRYDSFLRPKREAVVLKSSFADRMTTEMGDDDDDVTRIYSRDEVVSEFADNDSKKTKACAVERDSVSSAKTFFSASNKRNDKEKDLERDVAKINVRGVISGSGAREADGECDSACPGEKSSFDMRETKAFISNNRMGWECDDALETTAEKTLEEVEDDHCDDALVDSTVSRKSDGKNDFDNVKKHPFFADLILRLEKNVLRQRQQIKATGRYNLEAINLCLRPLLQLTDYPFTIRQLSEVAPFLYPSFLRRSLPDIKACRRLHIYRSVDTDVVLDWSVEDFLRRRYESIHLSWEPVQIVILRFGWNHEVMSDRDCMLYFSRFQNFIELAELELSAGDDKPRAIPIVDAVRVAEQRPIPLSRLLIRRKPVEDTEPSVTESIRLMGKPALINPAKSRKAQTSEKDTVEGTFERIQREAASVDGDEAARLRHAIDTVPSLRQATHPSGRSIKDFSLGKEKSTVLSKGLQCSSAKAESKSFDERHHTYTPELYDALANAYHKKKVEASQLRQRLLNTESIDHAAELQERLSLVQKELPRLRERLEKMRQLRRMEKEDFTTFYGSFHMADKRGNKETHMGPADTVEVATKTSFEEGNVVEMSKGMPHSYTISSSSAKCDLSKEKFNENCNAAEDNVEEINLTNGAVKNETESYDHTHHNVPPSEQIKYLSSTALMLRQEIENLQEKRRNEEEALFKKMEEAVGTLLKIEAAMNSASQRKTMATEQQRLAAEQEKQLQREEAEKQARREQTEARARALEKELLRKHEERMKILSKQREEARQAQREAEVALERQKQAEQAALEAETELERKLSEAKSRIWSGDGGVVSTAQKTPDDTATARTITREVPCSAASRINNMDNTAVELACTPEQYDGLCLGAERLRKEIMELERQMESEGDEDDMTLMAVLATLRSELEELEDFIRVVRQRESWAAERDKARKDEAERVAKERGKRPNDLQEKISAIRFQIDLMEKRLQHASERNVISKLEQKIINGRREINRLRVEQDRLRRSGLYADAGGIYVPPSISVAQTLAEAEAKDAESNADVAADVGYAQGEKKVVNTHRADEMHIDGEETEGMGVTRSETAKNADSSLTAGEHHGDDDGTVGDFGNSTADGLPKYNEDEIKQLTKRMELMLVDIKHLEDNIALKGDGRNAEATAALLAELQEKLQQLLEVRDAIRCRTGNAALDRNVLNDTTVLAAETVTKTKKPATPSRRPAVIAPPSGRPVSVHASGAGEEVLRFGHHPKATHHSASNRSAAASRKMKKITKSKKSRC